MKIKLLRHDKEPLILDVNNIKSIGGLSQSNVIVTMNTLETHTGYLVKITD